MAELLRIKDIAQQLNMPESTARYYRDKFIKYIPNQKKGKITRYNQTAVGIIKAISDYRKIGKSWDDIEIDLQLIEGGEDRPIESAFVPVTREGNVLSVSFRIMSKPATRGSNYYSTRELIKRKAWKYFKKPLAGKVNITYKFFTDNWRLDIDNMEKLVNDALNGVAWLDDRQIIESHTYKINIAEYNIEPHIQINVCECLEW